MGILDAIVVDELSQGDTAEGDALLGRDGLAELDALLGIAQRVLKRALGDPVNGENNNPQNTRAQG